MLRLSPATIPPMQLFAIILLLPWKDNSNETSGFRPSIRAQGLTALWLPPEKVWMEGSGVVYPQGNVTTSLPLLCFPNHRPWSNPL